MQTYTEGGGLSAAWDDELEALYSRLSGRGSFRYDAASDPLWTSYAERARLGGQLAMQDTMGRAAALTGGYGSSYAQAVGQREYDDYLRSLGEAMPQFYSLALQRWQAEGDTLRDRYELLYTRASDERERADAAGQAAWQRQQSNYASLVKLIQSAGYRPTDAELSGAGLSRAAADALLAAWQSQNGPRRVVYRTAKQAEPEEPAAAQTETQTAPNAKKTAASGGGRQRVRMTR